MEAFRGRCAKHIVTHRPDPPRLPGTRAPTRRPCRGTAPGVPRLFAAGLLGNELANRVRGGSGTHDPLPRLCRRPGTRRREAARPVGAWNRSAARCSATGPRSRRRTTCRASGASTICGAAVQRPDAGSDLAALRTAAVRTGDDWVVNGQKVWTTHAHVADLGLLLARTDPDASKTPVSARSSSTCARRAIDVRPLREMTGSTDFNECSSTTCGSRRATSSGGGRGLGHRPRSARTRAIAEPARGQRHHRGAPARGTDRPRRRAAGRRRLPAATSAACTRVRRWPTCSVWKAC